MTQFEYGFLGGGQIASALASGLITAQCANPGDLAVFDKSPQAAEKFCQRFGAKILENSQQLCSNSKTVFLCVKPGDVPEALANGAGMALDGKLLISVAAGVSIASLQRLVHPNCFICRTMPNKAAEIRKAITTIAFAPNVPDPLRTKAYTAFQAIGRAILLEEKFFDAAVALSGSGPAYACLLIEAMTQAGTELGLHPSHAQELSIHAILGGAALAAETSQPPEEIRKQISSPGGTTLAALSVFEDAHTREIIRRAVFAAAARSAELGKLLSK